MRQAADAYRAMAEAAARRYAPAGRFAMRYALGKLCHDPVFEAILAQGLIPHRARLVDLGCGQGLLLALLVAAIDAFDRGAWPAGWPPPPRPESMTGFDVSRRALALARMAAGAHASIQHADLRAVELPRCDAIAILDVLHYVDAAAQDAVLPRCAKALAGGGVLLLRVNDAGAGWRYTVTRSADQLATLARERSWPRLHCRPLADWIAALERVGFEVRSQPASAGTPFSNSLLVARRG
jgi:SAM-dependent methyltransferase